ncbi:hypothetical protein [Pedobacter xixiisoli]|uniref:hypothetical protein n=1 Tax=Pedobacter xixiisoli TaxID=1476464 RepID=UPI000BE3DE4E|nr:hypothetical protein [Pedobacter xixiisoli]
MLLKKAKQLGIEQAVIFTAKSVYLSSGRIIANISEIPSTQNPVYLELVDDYDKVMTYLRMNKYLLADAR